MRRRRRWILGFAIFAAAIAAGVVTYRLLNPTPIEPPVAARPKESDIVGRWKWMMEDAPKQLPEGFTVIYELRQDKTFTRTTIAPPTHDDSLDGIYEFDPIEMMLRKYTPTFIVKEHVQQVEKLTENELVLISRQESTSKYKRLSFARMPLNSK